MIYVYAIGDGAGPVAAPGLDERPVENIRHGRLRAFVSRGHRRALDPRLPALRRHERVVSALMDAGTILPMRFGTLVRDDDALHAFLDARGAELERTLARVRGRVELGVRAVWSGPPDDQVARSGRGFMRSKLERREAARRLAGAVHPPLAELAVDARCKLLPRDGTAFTGAYLADPARFAELERRAMALDSTQDQADLVFTGPWPPYSFSELRDA